MRIRSPRRLQVARLEDNLLSCFQVTFVAATFYSAFNFSPHKLNWVKVRTVKCQPKKSVTVLCVHTLAHLAVLKLNSDTMVSALRVLVLIIQFTACQCLICHRGEKWDQKNNICDDCDHGTFMPEHEHNHTECYPCTQVTDLLNEYVIRECSSHEDALIGSSRSNKTPCLNDTFYIRVKSDGVKVCTVRTMPCKQGQFFVSGDTCAPCPPGTYMVDNHHNNTACNSCQQLLRNQEFDNYVATACNITRNSI